MLPATQRKPFAPDPEMIFTVSQLNAEVKALIEGTFPLLWLQGEMSNFSSPASGHWYFSLKDAKAQIRCAMFRMSQTKLTFKPRDGQQVLVRARVSLYENRGDFQLIIEDMEELSEGVLHRAFLKLKENIGLRGWFDAKHKKPLPLYPKQIGVVTSPTGAAIRDILSVLKRRYPHASVIIYSTSVQGAKAATEITAMINTANRRAECDILIVARGGGSLEDLWPFNEEMVAEAIFSSQIPIVSGVGHEIDFTIADFVADQRAPTPSAAAEMVTPDELHLKKHLIQSKQYLIKYLKETLQQLKQKMHTLQALHKNHHPKNQLQHKLQALDLKMERLMTTKRHYLNEQHKHVRKLLEQLKTLSPREKIHALQIKSEQYQALLKQRMIEQIARTKAILKELTGTLTTLSPLATLLRGYVIIMNEQNEVIHELSQLSEDNILQLKFHDGVARVKISRLD